MPVRWRCECHPVSAIYRRIMETRPFVFRFHFLEIISSRTEHRERGEEEEEKEAEDGEDGEDE